MWKSLKGYYGNMLLKIRIVGKIGNAEPFLTEDFLDLIPMNFMSRFERISMDFTGHVFSLLFP